MASLVAWLFGVTSVAVAADVWVFRRFDFLPSWLPMLLSLAGLGISTATYYMRKKKRKAKKYRRGASVAFAACLLCSLAVTGYWLLQMLAVAASAL